MAHNICDKKIAYYGQKPWHGIGTELNAPATAEEAISAGGLDYEVQQRPIFANPLNPDRAPLELVGNKANVRVEKDGTEVPLGVVGDRYSVIQNKDAFSFFDAVVGAGEAKYHTVGALGQGERIWLLAKLPKDLILFRDDVVEKYLCLTNSHDGSSALRVYFTPVRVVCQNTLNASLKSVQGDSVSIRHSGNLEAKVQQAKYVLGTALEYFGEFDEKCRVLCAKELNGLQARDYFDRVLGIKDEKTASTRVKNQRSALFTLFEQGKGQNLPGVRHTAWAALNAVTEFFDHHNTVKGEDEDRSNRLKSIWFGASAQIKQKALAEALAL